MASNSILRLNEKQHKVIELIQSQLKKGSEMIALPFSMSEVNVYPFVLVALSEHPEWIQYNYSQIITETGPDFFRVKMVRAISPNTLALACEQLKRETKRILAEEITTRRNALQVVIAIHNYLARSVEYDRDDASGRKPNPVSHNAYGAIVKKKAVCEGIAAAFTLLANAMGIESVIVRGTAKDENHAWNIVKLGKGYYHLDVTWDLLDDTHVPKYDYFCLTDADMHARTWQQSIFAPCVTTQCNYFSLMDAVVHNEKQMMEKMAEQFQKNRQIYLKYDYLNLPEAETVRYFQKLFQRIMPLLRWSSVQYSIMVNSDQRIVRILGIDCV